MRIPASEGTRNGGLGGAAKQVAEHASTIARLELELAALELKKKLTALGLGLGLGVGAAIFGLIGLGFLCATVAAALETVLATWLSLLITAGILVGLAGLLGSLALVAVKKGTPPVPKQAIEEARLTSEALRR
jgi:putative superfamily III holin-X